MSFTNRIINANCSIIQSPSTDETAGSGRVGTCMAPEAELVKRFGPPQPVKVFDEKVTKSWYVKTPRGTVAIRDYWWNGKNEWSIAAKDNKAAKWGIRFLRFAGLQANNRTRVFH